jgi:hypothetical protein
VVLPLIQWLARFRIPGVRDALDSNHCLLEIPDPKMPKRSSANSSCFSILELLMWSALLLVNGNAEMPKKCPAAISNFGLSSLLCPDHSSSGPRKPRIPKFQNSDLVSLRLYTQKLFSRFGDLINQRFRPHFRLMALEMSK